MSENITRQGVKDLNTTKQSNGRMMRKHKFIRDDDDRFKQCIYCGLELKADKPEDSAHLQVECKGAE